MIGQNTEVHSNLRDVWERGYREAILDVFVFLTGNPQVHNLDTDHRRMIENMVNQVNQSSGLLLDVTDLSDDNYPLVQ